jgi:hypothetical protein
MIEKPTAQKIFVKGFILHCELLAKLHSKVYDVKDTYLLCANKTGSNYIESSKCYLLGRLPGVWQR